MRTVVALGCLGGLIFSQGDSAAVAGEQPRLEKAVFAFHEGMLSKDKQKQEAAVRGLMVTTKKDLEILFPKYAEKMWPNVERANKHYLNSIDKIAAELARHGKLNKVKTLDIRESEAENPGLYRRVLTMIPKNIPVYRIGKFTDDGGGDSETYLLVNGRWIWIREFYGVPEYLNKLDGKK